LTALRVVSLPLFVGSKCSQCTASAARALVQPVSVVVSPYLYSLTCFWFCTLNTPYTNHHTPYTIHHTHTPHTTHHTHTPYTIHHTPYTIHHTPYTIHHTPYTTHHTPYTIHHTPHTTHHTPYTTHHTPYTIHHTPSGRVAYSESRRLCRRGTERQLGAHEAFETELQTTLWRDGRPGQRRVITPVLPLR
jgi:hypothetical protein